MPTTLQLDPKDFLKKATTVASHYGFVSLENALKKEKKRNDKTKTIQIQTFNTYGDTFSREIINVLQTISDNSTLSFSRPKLIYHGNIHTREDRSKTAPPQLHFGLTVLGINKGIAEALILKAARAILDENGLKEQCIYINSIGDKDSALKFTRELSLCLRKNINILSAQGRQALKKNIFAALKYMQEHPCPEYENILTNIPKPMTFLSDTSRKHLKEVLEYLEATEMMYEIDDNLIGNKYYYKETLFEIHSANNSDIKTSSNNTNTTHSIKLAKGGRCDEIARKILRTNISAVGILFICNWKNRVMRSPLPKRKGRRPKYCLIQLGAKAKLKSLVVIEELRKANIPVHQSLNEDTLEEQLQIATELKVPYTLIIGQKEVIDNTVIVRKMDNQAQEIVALEMLPEHLRSMTI